MNPSPSEIVIIAVKMFGQRFGTGSTETRRGMLVNACWAWRQARDVIYEAPFDDKELEEISEKAIRLNAALTDRGVEALLFAEKSGETRVSWTDAMLWDAVGEGMGSGDSPSTVASRLHKKFKYRMEQRGRHGEIDSPSKGVPMALALEILRDDGWKPGPKPPGSPTETLPEN